MEYLIVHCAESRKVFVDGTYQGETEETIELDAGTYTITLEPAAGIRRPQRTVVLVGTTATNPREVSFALA